MKMQIRRKAPQEGDYTQGLCKLGVLLGGFPNEESISGAYWSTGDSNGERAGISILILVKLLSQQLGEHSKNCEKPGAQC